MLFSVAVYALVRRVLVHHDLFAPGHSRLRMTFIAGNMRMSPRECQMRFRVVVKRGGRPVLRVMAVRAVRLTVPGYELSIVGIPMAGLAELRCPFEPRFISRCRLMAVSARHRSMCSQQRKLRLRMVEPVDLPPGFHVVASLAAKWGSVRTLSCHLRVELALVRVLVASRASPVLEVEG